MINTVAIANYRSIRDLVLPLKQLNLVTGANGVGKSNLYKGLRLLSAVAHGTAVPALAYEGGLDSVLWAGPESFSRAVKAGEYPVQGGPRKDVIALRLGFVTDDFGYAIDFGIPVPVPATLFNSDPEIKREVIWHGDTWHERRGLVERTGSVVRARDGDGRWQVIEQHLASFDSLLTQVADPGRAPEAMALREELRNWRFYDHFRCDMDAPARQPQIGVRTPVLSNDGRDLAAAWRTVEEIGDAEGLSQAVSDAFPGARVEVCVQQGQFQLQFHQPGVLRGLSQRELSDGTLRYLLLVAALFTPRPPPLMILNEPETSLHPDLLPALGRLMRSYARDNQLWVVSHSQALQRALQVHDDLYHVELDKDLGETFVHGQDVLSTPTWKWPKR